MRTEKGGDILGPMGSMINNPPKIFLAPMEGVTDFVMRDLMTEIGGIDCCVSEFIRVTDHPPPIRVIRKIIPEMDREWKTRSGIPVIPQILGSDITSMTSTARNLELAGAPAIDINFGCPARTVNNHGGGAALLKCPSTLRALVQSITSSIQSIPISAKIRLGYDSPNEIFDIIKAIDDCGLSWITIHGRTKVEAYGPPAHWDMIQKANDASRTSIIANGDIVDAASFIQCLKTTKCSSVMIGRGILQNPFVFNEILNLRITQSINDILDLFIEKSISFYPDIYPASGRIKQWVKQLSKRHSKFHQVFEKIKRLENIDDIRDVIKLSNRNSETTIGK